ncbi:hypothetical protein [Rubrobacter taiwanensis]|jgi:hypothetical protein|uniref:hypothetical protein n=1 Tax=Rubrobacter taiwanensis TaxID=185139 RepID=UPI0014048621|nr:hypothetical protein [Rubrobacter taiwanensis]
MTGSREEGKGRRGRAHRPSGPDRLVLERERLRVEEAERRRLIRLQIERCHSYRRPGL